MLPAQPLNFSCASAPAQQFFPALIERVYVLEYYTPRGSSHNQNTRETGRRRNSYLHIKETSPKDTGCYGRDKSALSHLPRCAWEMQREPLFAVSSPVSSTRSTMPWICYMHRNYPWKCLLTQLLLCMHTAKPAHTSDC